MKISANEIKSGYVLDYENNLWVVSKNPEHTKPGKGRAYIQVEMKNLRTNTKLNKRFGSAENVEKAFLEHKKMQYLYCENDFLIFMDPKSFEQIMLKKQILDDKLPLLTETMEVEISFYQDTPLNVTLPSTLIVTIEETDPVIKGSTATSSYKPALLTNGLTVSVPPYLVSDDSIIIRTEDLTFIAREK